MQYHFKFATRSFLGVYRPHPAKALLPQDIATSYVLGGRQVRISPVSTGHTSEMQTNTVPLSNVPTPWAFLARIGRIYGRGVYAFLGKLIACLELHGRIWPPAHLLPKILAFFKGRLSDIAKVFEHDHPGIGLNGILGQGFRGNMQKMFRNGPFAVCQALQQSLGRPGTYGLNSRPSSPDTFSQVVKFSARKEEGLIVGGVRGNKHTHDAGIHSYNGPLLDKFWDFFFIAKNQIKFIFNLFKFRIFPSIFRNIGVIHGNGFSPEGDTFSGFIKISFPYQRKSSIFKDGQFPFFIGLSGLVCSSNMLANTASKLAGKVKFFSKSWIISLGEAIGIQFFRIECQRREPIKGLKIIFDHFGGLGRTLNFDFSGTDNFHYINSFIPV